MQVVYKSRKPLLQFNFRLISVGEATRIFQDSESTKTTWSESELKARYLKLAKKYHPDVSGGSKLKFQKLQSAFDRLKAQNQGFDLTEEDLFDMYSQKRQQSRQPKDNYYSDYQKQQREEEPIYNEEELRKEFEKWKRSRFTEYDREKHDEFLKTRYYKQHESEKFDTGSHFSHNNAQTGPDSGPAYERKSSSFKVAFKDVHERRASYEAARQVKQDQENKKAAVLLALGLLSNLWLWNYLKSRKRSALTFTEITQNSERIYIDKAAIRDMNLTDQDLLKMADNPQKYTLSNYVRRLVLKLKESQ